MSETANGWFSREALSTYFERRSFRAFLEGDTRLADEFRDLSIDAHRGDLDRELLQDTEADW